MKISRRDMIGLMIIVALSLSLYLNWLALASTKTNLSDKQETVASLMRRNQELTDQLEEYSSRLTETLDRKQSTKSDLEQKRERIIFDRHFIRGLAKIENGEWYQAIDELLLAVHYQTENTFAIDKLIQCYEKIDHHEKVAEWKAIRKRLSDPDEPYLPLQ